MGELYPYAQSNTDYPKRHGNGRLSPHAPFRPEDPQPEKRQGDKKKGICHSVGAGANAELEIADVYKGSPGIGKIHRTKSKRD